MIRMTYPGRSRPILNVVRRGRARSCAGGRTIPQQLQRTSRCTYLHTKCLIIHFPDLYLEREPPNQRQRARDFKLLPAAAGARR